MRHVVILKPAFSGLIAYRTVDRMVQEQELHRITDSLVNARGIRADFHVVRDRSRARRHELGRAFQFDQTHAATAFNPDVRVIAIARNVNADFVGNLDDGFTFFDFVYLAVNRDLGHKKLE